MARKLFKGLLNSKVSVIFLSAQVKFYTADLQIVGSPGQGLLVSSEGSDVASQHPELCVVFK